MKIKENTFLIAIGTEDLPSKILKKLGKDFLKHIIYEFSKNNIHYSSIDWFISTRHLAIKSKISIIHQHQNTTTTTYAYLNKNYKKILLEIIKIALGKLTNYNMMRWGNGNTTFIRPVNTVTVLLDSYLIEGSLFEVNIDRIIYGHRYIQNNKIILNHADDYPDFLTKKGYIIANYNLRKQTIQTAVENQASQLGGIVDMRDNNFLEEITALTEWPVVLFGKFSKKFLKLPSEIIIHIMKQNQKYFPVFNIIDGILLPYFIFVIDIISKDYKEIINGHENVITSRFMDIEFFLNNDNQLRLEDHIPKLNSILFHKNLGNLKEKVDRIRELSGWIANNIKEDIFQSKRAGYLCKCDLTTHMVLEFPETQGIIGMYYALRDGESKKVALAQKEHYQPKFNTDALPTEQISCIVSIADKIDTVIGILGTEKNTPTGSRDPFGLKRITTGILNIIIKKEIKFNFSDFIDYAIELYGTKLINKEIIKIKVHNFIKNRLCLLYHSQGYKINIIQSIIKSFKNLDIINCNSKIKAIHNFYKTQEKEDIKLNSVYKRISNILRNQNILLKENNIISTDLFKVLEETKLFKETLKIEKQVNLLLKQHRYNDALIIISKLAQLTGNFLNKVHILVKEKDIKINRLILINKIKLIILKVVDIPGMYHI